MRESQIEKYLTERVKAAGGLCWKFVSPGMPGVPDRIAMLPSGRLVFVELKAPDKTAKPHQERRHRDLWRMGQAVVVLDSIEKVDAFMGGLE
jgi:hypothetical protein